MTKSERELILSWLRKIRISEAGQRYASVRAQRYHYCLGVPMVALSAASGTAVFATLQEQSSLWLKLLVGTVTVIVAVLASLQTLTKYAERAEKHRSASARYEGLKHRLEQLLMVPQRDDSSYREELADVREKWDAFNEESPNVPERQWQHAREMVDRTVKYRSIVDDSLNMSNLDNGK